MTKLEFPGSALTTDQWAQVNQLATSLSQEQAIWISGYFAGLSHQARTLASTSDIAELSPPFQNRPAAAPATRLLTVLFGSETGNSKALAKSLVEKAKAKGIEARLADMADYKTRGLKDEQDLLVITSTHGEGDAPQTAVGFFEFLESRKAPKLPQLR
jgi:sulfite reductase (NADPH) flavoprotein alpha-component